DSFPGALATSRPRVVTRPDVEKALYKWIKSMEERGEIYSGAMLMEKRARFEKHLNVPESECLHGHGWINSFKKAYGIREHVRHGEAGSLDPEMVEAERVRVREKLARYRPEDRFNADETGLFAYAPPDRGLATAQMSGKKKERFRITLLFACNSTGSEKRPIMFIGKSKKPRCFKRPPGTYGFYYRNNKSSWMTSALFEEWIKDFDLDMRSQGRHIILLIDNFSGHAIDYIPTNIEIEFFTPNLTAAVQPLDAGVIRCVKAHYRIAFCIRALDLDDAGEANIFKINLREVMHMALKAWEDVSPETIAHCW
ncbi:DDE-domain-containing protein, partial [Punctularia strigosozonata HHB-11173 SS5]|uniref:DDE-domain-containing protein n=1 Tax=Punctularia strigosozonata (strain HHB-11173) TaxID=741275 RepID=UPI0004416EA4